MDEQTDIFKRLKEECIDATKAKKVLAPFLRTLRKKKTVRAEIVQEEFQEFYLQRKPTEVLAKLTRYFTDTLEVTTLLNETAEILKEVTKSKGVAVYLADYDLNEITLTAKYVQDDDRNVVKYKIEIGTTLAAFVAFTKEFVMLDDMMGDTRFPDGIPFHGLTIQSVLCVPVLTSPEGNCIAVVELFKELEDEPYSGVDLQITVAVTGWMGVAIHQNNERLMLMKRIELHEYLTAITQLYFSGTISYDKIISDFIIFAKTALRAERGYFFSFAKPVKQCFAGDIMADVYEEALQEEDLSVIKKCKQKRFKLRKAGVPGYVARYGRLINIQDAYLDHRFDRSSDLMNYRTRGLISFPIKDRHGVMGVLQFCNKLDGPFFTSDDEKLLQTFAGYGILSSQYSHMSSKLKRSELTVQIDSDLIQQHIRPCLEDLQELLVLPLLTKEQMPAGFFGFDWYIGGFEEEACKYVLFVFLNSGLFESPPFDFDNTAQFALAVRKSYRDVPYHNFDHAFTVFHCAFNILNKNKDRFTEVEMISMLIAALCHDSDHFGFTNSFLELTKSPLAELYESSFLENHHYRVCQFILSATELLSNFTGDTYTRILTEIHNLILATDLYHMFEHKSQLVELLNNETFDWTNDEHRHKFKCIIIVLCDLSGQLKPFDIARRISESLYKEFYHQGDLEKGMDLKPLSTMDREKAGLMPENQLLFLNILCVPAVELLVAVLSNLDQLSVLAKEALDKWKEIIDLRNVEVWKPTESVPRERKPRRRVGTLVSSYSISARSIASSHSGKIHT